MLTRRRVYVLPTRQGASFLLLTLLVLIGAVNYGNSLAYVLAFLLGAVFLLTPLHTYRNLAGVRLGAGRSPEVFAGETARFPLTLSAAPGRAAVALELRVPPARSHAWGWAWPGGRRPHWRRGPRPPEREAGTGGVRLDIEPDSPARVELARVMPRRGRHALGPVRVESRYPLGLFRAWSRVDIGLECLVYPAPGGTAPLPAAVARGSGERGGGRGVEEFAGLRPYLPGDPPRRLDWKRFARSGELEVKRFEGGGAEELELDYGRLAGEAEARLSQLCRWVLEAERLGLAFALVLPGERIPADAGGAHGQRCLRALATVGEPR